MRDVCFGNNLKKLREKRGMTLQELSMRTGIHQSTISRLENDPRCRPHIETFVQLARGFEVSIQEFAILTEVIEPDGDPTDLSATLFNYFHLFTRQNLLLLNDLETMDLEIRDYLVSFISGLQSILQK